MTTFSNANSSAAAPAVIVRSQVQTYDISQSKDSLELATDLARFIQENKLTTNVQGKEFVNVEGWQYAGSRLGIVPIVEHILSRSTDQELKYEARVSLFDIRHQVTVGQGFAICSSKESGKKFWQEYAILSMAQTRAIGKAYRNVLAWIIRAAGYEPTPAEEMDQAQPQPTAGVTGGPVQVTVMAATPAAVVEEPAPVEYASQEQRENIIRLLNHPKIGRQEKTNVLLTINRIDSARAEARITQLVHAIEARTGTFVSETSKFIKYTSAPAPALEASPSTAPAPVVVNRATRPQRSNTIRENAEAALRDFVLENDDLLGEKEAQRLLNICGNSRYSPADIREELEAAKSNLSKDCAA
jgi:hypothetical protein